MSGLGDQGPNAQNLPTFGDFFIDRFTELSNLLDGIVAEASKGVKEAAVAYVNAYSGNASKNIIGAKSVIESVVKLVSDDDTYFFAGLQFSDASTGDKRRNDIVNSLLSSWDSAAAKYMKGSQADGDVLREKLKARLVEFDAALRHSGNPAVSPDA